MEEDVSRPEPPPERTESGIAKLHKTRVPLWVPLVLLLLLVAALVWRQVGIGAAERRLESQREELVQQTEAERAAIRTRAQQALAQASEDAHMLFGTALAWTVRSAMIRQNGDEIDQYIVTLAQHPRIELVLLADAQGQILLASDRALLGAPLAEHFPPAFLETAAVMVHRGQGDQRRLVLPIQGLNERLGTMIVVYTAPTLPANN